MHQLTCAECGTTEATTYVVTTLFKDMRDRTEVCRACDDALRIVPIIEQFRQHADEIMPDRDPNVVDFTGEADEMEADTWVAAAEELRIALHIPHRELCTQCGEAESEGYGMCPSCFHDAIRSGWTPGRED